MPHVDSRKELTRMEQIDGHHILKGCLADLIGSGLGFTGGIIISEIVQSKQHFMSNILIHGCLDGVGGLLGLVIGLGVGLSIDRSINRRYVKRFNDYVASYDRRYLPPSK